MRSPCVAVPKEAAERIRRELLSRGLLRKGLAIARDGDTIFIPVTDIEGLAYPVLEREFPEAFTPVRSYKDVADVPPELRPLMPTSYDIIGDIAIIKIPDELARHEREIARAVLAAHASVRVVAADAGVKGPLRIRDLRILAGPNRTETVHREHGLAYKVDAARAYFSPRLGTERQRVANQVQPGEVVVDMFAGVGPYAILIAKRRKPEAVYAIDANPDAFRYLEENVRRNRADSIVPELGDALKAIDRVEPPNRVIIDYPQDPDPAYHAALSRLRRNGTIHYYAILETAEREDREHDIVEGAKALNRNADIISLREVHGWSPTQRLFAFDVRVS